MSPTACKKSKNALIESAYFAPDREIREKALLLQTLKDAALGNTVITSVHGTGNPIGRLGLVALSVGRVEIETKPFPVVVIDFLFVDHRYRKQRFGDDRAKVSEMLIFYAIQEAEAIKKRAGVRYLILRPDGGRENEKLAAFYISMGFQYMTKRNEWMFLRLS